ncbi:MULTISPECIES: helix-turn-helix domain-containing protein [unclassified Bradyrhizobium]
MTQEEFAGRFGFSVNTLCHWEQGSRQPEGPTRAYLLAIERARRQCGRLCRPCDAFDIYDKTAVRKYLRAPVRWQDFWSSLPDPEAA